MTWVDILITIIIGGGILFLGIWLGKKLGLDTFRRKLE